MLEALWRRTSAIAEDCTRWNHVLREKEKEAEELASMIRHLSEEYMGTESLQPSQPAANTEHTQSEVPGIVLPCQAFPADHAAPHALSDVDLEVPVQSLPSGAAESTQVQQAPDLPEATDDIYSSSPARTQHAESFCEAVPEVLSASEENRCASIEHKELEPAVDPGPTGHEKTAGNAALQDALGDGEEGELFAKVRAALSRVVGGDAASALHDPATILIPPGWQEKVSIPNWEEKARPAPEPAAWPIPHEHGMSPFTASVGGSTMTAEQDPSSESAGLFPTEAEDHAAALSPEHTEHKVDVPEEAAHPVLFSECLAATSLEERGDVLPNDSTTQPLSWDSLALPLAELSVQRDELVTGASMPHAGKSHASEITSPALPPEALGRPGAGAKQRDKGSTGSSRTAPKQGRGERSAEAQAPTTNASGSWAPLRKKAPAGTPQAQASGVRKARDVATRSKRSQGSASASPPRASPKRGSSPPALLSCG